jgi:hypothetical protein
MRLGVRIVLLVVLATAFAVGTPSASAFPEGGGANNVVIAQTMFDTETLVRSTLQLSSVGGDSVTSANIATATATACTGCHSTAVAVQVVLVTGTPSYFVPANAATAVNAGCTACGSFAYAWQYVPQVSRGVHLSGDAQQQIAALRTEISQTAASIVPTDLASAQRLHALLDTLTAQVRRIVDGEIHAAGADAWGEPVARVHLAPAN